MKTKHKNTVYPMKKLVMFLLLLSSFCYAQPDINDPTPLTKCDMNNDTFESFDLTTKYAEILGSLDTGTHGIDFYTTLDGAQNTQMGGIMNPTSFVTIAFPIQTVYARVTDYTTSLFSVTSLDLVLIPTPTANQPSDIIINENPNDGMALFNLIDQSATILNGQSGMSVSYYSSLNEAINDINPIINATTYTNASNPQTIGVRVFNNATGCYSITSFSISVNGAVPINNPTPIVKCDNDSNGLTSFDLLSKNAEIMGSLSSTEYTLNYYETIADAQMGSFPIDTNANYENIIPFSQTVWVKVTEIADSANFSTTSLQLIANPAPLIPSNIPVLVMYENPSDGSATFDLTLQDSFLLNGSTTFTVTYYPTLIDAQSSTNPILNTTNYTGTHLQTIYATIFNPDTSCYSITSFTLKVFDTDSVVYIPDNNFRLKLIQAGVDTNSDGAIQYSEASVVNAVNVGNSNISDLTGIQSFTNITILGCEYNQLTSLNVSGLSNLTLLNCSYNLLNSLTILGCTNLMELRANDNQLTTIDFTGLSALSYLNLDNNLITTLDLGNSTNFTNFSCNSNLLTSLNVDNRSFTNFYCTGNPLTSFSAVNSSGLIFNCSGNQINNLNITNSNFTIFNCSSNQLSSIDLSTVNISFEFHCDSNLFTSIDVSNTQFANFTCANNLLTTLDVSTCTNLTTLDCNNNPLTSLYLKNGRSEFVNFPNDPNLLFICADDNQITNLQASANPATVISSYCSITPGGNYNTIEGNVLFDHNSNGCDASDFPQSYIKININDGAETGATFTNGAAFYNFYTGAGTFNLSPQLENPSIFTFTPSPLSVVFPDNNNNVSTQNICISANGVYYDLEVVIVPISAARPGFEAQYQITYRNIGNTVFPVGQISLDFEDDLMDYISSSQTVLSQTQGMLTWGFTNLYPFETRSIEVEFEINSPTDTPAVAIGEELNFAATGVTSNFEENVVNNLFPLKQVVVGSFDPNDITCLQGETLAPSEIGNYLHYIVNFENTGNFYAENVVVKLDIDTTKFDISTLQLLNTSHSPFTRITGNKVEFIFEGIYLDAVGGNPPVGGHGNVLFKIKSKEELSNGDTVAKRANIYFDYNAPIDTNIAQTTYQSLIVDPILYENDVVVFPNPTSGNINITSKFNIKSVELYDIQGRILETVIENSNESILDVSKRQNGIYFLKITTDEGSKVEKIIKE
ncbi:MAG: T9SS type A sorting domain-containing protein [Flavobacteriales bacterium]|nr:T9SS type A sorting domain-containing protein [Flavobacteriales bacterium]